MRENAHRPTTSTRALARALLSNRVGVEGEKLHPLRWSRNDRIFKARIIRVRVYIKFCFQNLGNVKENETDVDRLLLALIIMKFSSVSFSKF